MELDPAFEKKLSKELEDVYTECISLDKNSKSGCVKDYNEVVKNIMKELKNTDKLFKCLYTDIFYTGSYYDGLRVSEATEFDLDVVLKLPMCAEKIEIDIRQVPPGFVKINVADELKRLRQHVLWTEVYRSIDNWINKDGFIEEEAVRKWFESIVSKCLNVRNEWIDDSGNQYKVNCKKSGPAITLQINRSRGALIDVDLVPVIQFQTPKWPNRPVRECPQNKKTWFVVPKNNRNTNKSVWRLAFPQQELEMFEKKGILKKTLKILKKLRDVQKWKFLSSYYIKTIFLWEVEERKRSPEFWNRSLGFLFLYMLNKLKERLEEGRIDFFWHNGCNLLQNSGPKAPISPIVINEAYKRLNNIINKLLATKDASLVRGYLVTEEDKERHNAKCVMAVQKLSLSDHSKPEGFKELNLNAVTVSGEQNQAANKSYCSVS